MFTFTLTHGLSRNLTDEADGATTISQILANDSYRAILKHGEATDAIVNGVVQDQGITLADLGNNVTISLETRSNSKA